jgi:hypothetical protein
MIKLVVSDIDGTLFDTDEVITKEAVELVSKLHQHGIFFSLATGRVESMANHFATQLGLHIPYVACNGATLVQDGTAIYRQQIPVMPLRPLIERADALQMSIIYSQSGVESIWRETPYILSQRGRFNRYHREHQFNQMEWETLAIDKLTIMDEPAGGAMDQIEIGCRKLGSEFGYTRYVDRSIEVVHSSASKASGVERLAAMLGIVMDQVLFIGDHQNDIQLIKEAGIGVAVGNSTDDVKKAADYVCIGDSMDGVIEAVQRFCFGEIQ